MDERYRLVQSLSEELIATYDAAEDYSEDKLYWGLSDACELGGKAQVVARQVFEGAVEMVIDELLTTDVGLELLYRINAYRRELNTDIRSSEPRSVAERRT